MKQLFIHTLALALILGSATVASRHARGFLLIGQTPPQTSNLLLVNPGVMAFANTGMPLKVQ
jgi:H+/gluconate symporter-like permease